MQGVGCDISSEGYRQVQRPTYSNAEGILGEHQKSAEALPARLAANKAEHY